MAKLTTINIDKRISNLIPLNRLITSLQPSIINIQDTPNKLRKRPMQEFQVLMGGYTLIENNQHSSLWTLRHTQTTSIWKQPEEHTLDEKIHLTLMGLSIELPNNRTLKCILVNIYIRPRARPKTLSQALHKIRSYTEGKESQLIIMGDLNAQSLIWEDSSNHNEGSSDTQYNNIKANRGRQIEKFLTKHRLWCANKAKPNEHTYEQGNRITSIDLILLGNKVKRSFNNIRFDTLESQGHRAITVKLEAGSHHDTNQISNTRCNHTRIQQPMFESLIIEGEKLINNWRRLSQANIVKRMNLLTEKLYSNLLHIQAQTQTKRGRRVPKEASDDSSIIRKRLRKLKRAEGRVQKDTNLLKKKVLAQDPCQYKRNKAKLIESRRKLIRCIVNKRLEKEDNLWERVDKFRALDGESKTTGRELTENELETVMDLKFPAISRTKIWQEVESEPTEVDDTEAEAAILDISKKTYTGPEGLNFRVFVKSLEFVRKLVINICKMSFHTGKIPEVCKLTQGTLIPKPNGTDYRIVHVGTPLSSLLETIALHKLEHQLEARQLIAREQYGFTAARGRHDLIARVLERCIKGHEIEPQTATTTLVSLDIEGAFDNVDQDTIISNIQHNLEHPLKHWLTDFILNRNIRIKHGQLTSSIKQICKGVPQGSPIGPVLWNLAINRLGTDQMNDDRIETLRYADDLLIVYNDNDHKQLQEYLNKLIDELGRMKLRVKAEKCSYMIMKLGRRGLKIVESLRDKCRLSINNAPIKMAKKIKVLGVSINDMLDINSLCNSSSTASSH